MDFDIDDILYSDNECPEPKSKSQQSGSGTSIAEMMAASRKALGIDLAKPRTSPSSPSSPSPLSISSKPTQSDVKDKNFFGGLSPSKQQSLSDSANSWSDSFEDDEESASPDDIEDALFASLGGPRSKSHTKPKSNIKVQAQAQAQTVSKRHVPTSGTDPKAVKFDHSQVPQQVSSGIRDLVPSQPESSRRTPSNETRDLFDDDDDGTDLLDDSPKKRTMMAMPSEKEQFSVGNSAIKESKTSMAPSMGFAKQNPSFENSRRRGNIPRIAGPGSLLESTNNRTPESPKEPLPWEVNELKSTSSKQVETSKSVSYQATTSAQVDLNGTPSAPAVEISKGRRWGSILRNATADAEISDVPAGTTIPMYKNETPAKPSTTADSRDTDRRLGSTLKTTSVEAETSRTFTSPGTQSNSEAYRNVCKENNALMAKVKLMEQKEQAAMKDIEDLQSKLTAANTELEKVREASAREKEDMIKRCDDRVCQMEKATEERIVFLSDAHTEQLKALKNVQDDANNISNLMKTINNSAARFDELHEKIGLNATSQIESRELVARAAEERSQEAHNQAIRMAKDLEKERQVLQELTIKVEASLKEQQRYQMSEKSRLEQESARIKVMTEAIEVERERARDEYDRQQLELRNAQDQINRERKTLAIDIAEQRRQLALERAEISALRHSAEEHANREKAKTMELHATVDESLRNLQKDTIDLDKRSAQLRGQREELEERRRRFRDDIEAVEDEKLRLTDLANVLQVRSQELLISKEEVDKKHRQAIIALNKAHAVNGETAEARAAQVQRERELDRLDAEVTNQRVMLARDLRTAQNSDANFIPGLINCKSCNEYREQLAKAKAEIMSLSQAYEAALKSSALINIENEKTQVGENLKKQANVERTDADNSVKPTISNPDRHIQSVQMNRGVPYSAHRHTRRALAKIQQWGADLDENLQSMVFA